MKNKTISKVTILMYHFVRELGHGLFPRIKGTSVEDFERHVDYLSDNSDMISVDDILCALSGQITLPKKSVLLTFDDGYIDHYNNVFPILKDKCIQGLFFPSAAAVLEGNLLDDDKVQLCLGTTPDSKNIAESLISIIDNFDTGLKDSQTRVYYNKLAVASKFEDKYTVFIKKMTQRVLHGKLKSKVCSELIKLFIGADEEYLARCMYMNTEQLSTMSKSGMHIGGHGYSHAWATTQSFREKENEINSTVKMLDSIGVCHGSRTYSYPHGDYDSEMISILDRGEFRLAFTATQEVAQLFETNRFVMPRMYPENAHIDKQRNQNQ